MSDAVPLPERMTALEAAKRLDELTETIGALESGALLIKERTQNGHHSRILDRLAQEYKQQRANLEERMSWTSI